MFTIKNRFEVREDATIIFVDRPDGQIIEVLIDRNDLPKAMSFPNSWGATNVGGRKWQIKGTYRENKIKKNITLSRYLLDIEDRSPVRFINSNPLDHRRSNLTVGYEEVQITKGNDYEIHNDTVVLKLNKRDGTFLYTQIDREDLERVLDKGTWFAEWHADFNNFLVQNVSYFYTNSKKHRKKATLHSFIMGTDSKAPIKHVDGDTLNNCKSNLKVYRQTMMNDYQEIDNETVAIILRDKQGKEKARTLIDKEDLERVLNNGYTWFYVKAPEGYPYAVANSVEGRIYLHRFIMNTPDDMETDHKFHNTLDNRKQNLINATKSENQQNRKGARKGSKSGVRGVSWDETHQDWVVVIKGKHYGRFKEMEKAEELANEIIEEVMPYLNKKQGN